MLLEALGAAVLVALISLVGVFFFGSNKNLLALQRFVIPVAVGVFLSLVLVELIPETLELSPEFGGIAVIIGFIAFYVLASILHEKYHEVEGENCDQKGAAILLLIGDAIHNMADGVVLGGAFLINPVVGFGVALGLALHEIPQEIIEFGVLVKAGYSRTRAALLNLLSASSIIIGTLLIFAIAEYAENYIWVLTGIAAGNLLFLAASDLLPRIHDGIKTYGGIWNSTVSLVLGFVVMTSVLGWTHDTFGHSHAHEGEHEDIAEHIDEHLHDEDHDH